MSTDTILDRALELAVKSAGAPQSDEIVLKRAEAFAAFLRGDTKIGSAIQKPVANAA
jgi:hypothetical protein